MKRNKGKHAHESSDQNYFIYTQTNAKRKPMKKKSRGPWTIKENQAYLQFLKDNKQLFDSQFVRRSQKVFQKLAKTLKRRNPEQCRSHHQKFQVKHNYNTEEIIAALEQKIEADKKIRDMNAQSPMKCQPIDDQYMEAIQPKADNIRTLEDEQNEKIKKIKDTQNFNIFLRSNNELSIKLLNWTFEEE